MQREEIAELAVQKIADVLGVDATEVTEKTDLRRDFEVDSLELMEMGARLEQAFGIRLQVEDLVKMDTVGDAVTLLEIRLGVPA
ncbi:acyl carrier protein [Lentzea sp. NPDC051838]|uniref:acyl carrier protein n=1 Tax=Lentzea sp. NPDC051838 TaxID=3154849 RepID=UPI003432E92B